MPQSGLFLGVQVPSVIFFCVLPLAPSPRAKHGDFPGRYRVESYLLSGPKTFHTQTRSCTYLYKHTHLNTHSRALIHICTYIFIRYICMCLFMCVCNMNIPFFDYKPKQSESKVSFLWERDKQLNT